MHVIALQGPGSTGKTTSIVLASRVLKTLFPDGVSTVMKLSKRDVSILFVVALSTKKTVRIGIESRGDTEDVVEGALDALLKARCDVILCASRTSGGSVEALNKFVLENGCTLSVRRKQRVAPPLRLEENAKMATQLLGDLVAEI